MFLHNLPKNLIQPFLNMAYSLVTADGIVSEEEKETFALYTIELHLAEMPECEVVDYDEILPLFSRLSNSIKREVYFELLSLAHTDSDYDDREKSLLEKVADAFFISVTDRIEIERIIRSLLQAYKDLGVIING